MYVDTNRDTSASKCSFFKRTFPQKNLLARIRMYYLMVDDIFTCS